MKLFMLSSMVCFTLLPAFILGHGPMEFGFLEAPHELSEDFDSLALVNGSKTPISDFFEKVKGFVDDLGQEDNVSPIKPIVASSSN